MSPLTRSGPVWLLAAFLLSSAVAVPLTTSTTFGQLERADGSQAVIIADNVLPTDLANTVIRFAGLLQGENAKRATELEGELDETPIAKPSQDDEGNKSEQTGEILPLDPALPPTNDGDDENSEDGGESDSESEERPAFDLHRLSVLPNEEQPDEDRVGRQHRKYAIPNEGGHMNKKLSQYRAAMPADASHRFYSRWQGDRDAQRHGHHHSHQHHHHHHNTAEISEHDDCQEGHGPPVVPLDDDGKDHVRRDAISGDQRVAWKFEPEEVLADAAQDLVAEPTALSSHEPPRYAPELFDTAPVDKVTASSAPVKSAEPVAVSPNSSRGSNKPKVVDPQHVTPVKPADAAAPVKPTNVAAPVKPTNVAAPVKPADAAMTVSKQSVEQPLPGMVAAQTHEEQLLDTIGRTLERSLSGDKEAAGKISHLLLGGLVHMGLVEEGDDGTAVEVPSASTSTLPKTASVTATATSAPTSTAPTESVTPTVPTESATATPPVAPTESATATTPAAPTESATPSPAQPAPTNIVTPTSASTSTTASPLPLDSAITTATPSPVSDPTGRAGRVPREGRNSPNTAPAVPRPSPSHPGIPSLIISGMNQPPVPEWSAPTASETDKNGNPIIVSGRPAPPVPQVPASAAPSRSDTPAMTHDWQSPPQMPGSMDMPPRMPEFMDRPQGMPDFRDMPPRMPDSMDMPPRMPGFDMPPRMPDFMDRPPRMPDFMDRPPRMPDFMDMPPMMFRGPNDDSRMVELDRSEPMAEWDSDDADVSMDSEPMDEMDEEIRKDSKPCR